MYFVNWQRDISVEEKDGRKVVVKRNKPTKDFHEFLISYVYTLISILLARPSPPNVSEQMTANEGQSMRATLANIGIATPELIGISDEFLVEEFVQGGDLYRALASSSRRELVYGAGSITGRLHRAGYAFVDNKAQNYLVKEGQVVRTDLAFTQKTRSSFAISMDIGSFLASVIDLERYEEIEQAFFEGYLSETGRKFSFSSIVIRNLLSLGFSSDTTVMLRNLILDTRPVIDL